MYKLPREYYSKPKKNLVFELGQTIYQLTHYKNEAKFYKEKADRLEKQLKDFKEAHEKLERELLDLGDDGYFDPYSPPNSPTACALDLAAEVDVVDLTGSD